MAVASTKFKVSRLNEHHFSQLLTSNPFLRGLSVAVNFLGWIVYYSGCHCGSVPDDTIYNNTYHEHPLKSWEFWCADGIYDSCHGVLTRYIQGGGGVLTQFESFMNR